MEPVFQHSDVFHLGGRLLQTSSANRDWKSDVERTWRDADTARNCVIYDVNGNQAPHYLMV